MKIVIQTQHHENYGAHDWNGEGECPQYWKAKGGDTLIVENVTVEQGQDKEYWTALEGLINSSDEYFVVSIIAMDLIDDEDFVLADHIEAWETPTYITFENGHFVATKTSTWGFHDCIEKMERTWLLGSEETGGAVWTLKDGRIMNTEQVNAECQRVREEEDALYEGSLTRAEQIEAAQNV